MRQAREVSADGPKASVRSRRRWRAAAAAVWILSFLLINVATGNALYHNFQLALYGRTTTGTVTALQPSVHEDCTYEYQVERRTYSNTDAGCAMRRSLHSSLSVTYLPSHPAVATTGSAVPAFWESLLFFFGGPTILAAVLFFGVRPRFTR